MRVDIFSCYHHISNSFVSGDIYRYFKALMKELQKNSSRDLATLRKRPKHSVRAHPGSEGDTRSLPLSIYSRYATIVRSVRS